MDEQERNISTTYSSLVGSAAAVAALGLFVGVVGFNATEKREMIDWIVSMRPIRRTFLHCQLSGTDHFSEIIFHHNFDFSLVVGTEFVEG